MSSIWTDIANSDASRIAEAEAQVAWAKYLMEDAQSAYYTYLAGDDGDVLKIDALPTTTTELQNAIRHGGGELITDINNPRVALAKKNWWQFSVAISDDKRYVKITENNYLLYGGIGLAALLVVLIVAHQ